MMMLTSADFDIRIFTIDERKAYLGEWLRSSSNVASTPYSSQPQHRQWYQCQTCRLRHHPLDRMHRTAAVECSAVHVAVGIDEVCFRIEISGWQQLLQVHRRIRRPVPQQGARRNIAAARTNSVTHLLDAIGARG